MLKYHQIIKNLSEEEKIKLIVSETPFTNGNVANYNLPIINVDSSLRSCDTQNKFPSYNTIAYSWNLELVRKVGYTIGKQNLYAKNDKALGLNVFSCADEKFSTNKYLTARMANSCLEGMNKANAFSTLVNNTSYESMKESDVRKEFLPFEFVMSNSENQPSAVYVGSLHDVDYLRNDNNYTGLIMCEVSTPSELVKALNKKCHVIVYQGDANEVILPLLRKHQDKRASVEYGEISEEVYNDLHASGVVLNPDVIDEILDELLDHLATFDDKICSYEHKIIPTTVCEEVANESIVLLHNNGILPITPNTSVYLLGKQFFEINSNNYGDKTPVEYFRKKQINVVGAANGYEEGLYSNEAIVKLAIGNSEVANTTVIYLKQDEETKEFPAEQIQLLTDLSTANRRVVAFVEAKYSFNFELFKNCAAVLYVEEASYGFIQSLVDILTGFASPSGRLTHYLPKDGETVVNPLDKATYALPLGYGLTYSDVKYSNLKVYNLGITVTLKNESSFIVSEVPQLYVSQYDKENNLLFKELRGFKKVTLHPNECVNVTIPFDKYTFSTFNDQHNCYEIKGGTYHITLANNAESSGLTSEVKIAHKLYNGLNEDLEIKFIDNEDFNSELLKEEVANKGLSYKSKLSLSIISMIYLDVIFLISLGYNLIFSKYGTVLGVVVVLVLVNVLLGIYIKKLVKQKRLYGEKYVKPALTLNNMLNEMGNFKEVAKVTYYEPVKEEVLEEEKVEEVPVIVEEEKVEEVSQPEETVCEEVDTRAYTGDDYNVKYTSDIVFDTEITFEEYVRLFSNFVSSRGIIIEPKSARILLSSLFSTRLLILRSPSKQLLPKFKELLSEFFDDTNNRIDMSSISSFKDLIWKEEDEKYVRTDFVKLLYRTKSLKRHFSICDLDNVDVKTLREQLGGIYNYIKNPNDLYQINIGSLNMPESYTLPKNLYFIATANDEDYLDSIDKDLALHSLSIELMLRENEVPSVEDVQIKYVSTTRMSLMLKEFKEKQFLNEKEWKKIDDLEESINDMSSFRIENKSVLDFEKLAALMLNCDGSVDEVLDLMLASRLVPVLKSNPIYSTKNGDKTLYTMMEKIFGEDNIPMTKRAMVKNN